MDFDLSEEQQLVRDYPSFRKHYGDRFLNTISTGGSFYAVLEIQTKDEQSKNAQLLIKAGYIHKEMAGVYSMLPLGFRVSEKVKAVVRTGRWRNDGA